MTTGGITLARPCAHLQSRTTPDGSIGGGSAAGACHVVPGGGLKTGLTCAGMTSVGATMQATLEHSVTLLVAVMLNLLYWQCSSSLLALLFSLQRHGLPLTACVLTVVFSARKQCSALVRALGSLGCATWNVERLSAAGTVCLDCLLAWRTLSLVTLFGACVATRRQLLRASESACGNRVGALLALQPQGLDAGLATVTVGLSRWQQRTLVRYKGVTGLRALVDATVKGGVTDILARETAVLGLHFLVNMAGDGLFGFTTETFGLRRFGAHRTESRVAPAAALVLTARHQLATYRLAAPALVWSENTWPLSFRAAAGTGQDRSHGRALDVGSWMARGRASVHTVDGLATSLSAAVGDQFVHKGVLHLATPTCIRFGLFLKTTVAGGTFPGAFVVLVCVSGWEWRSETSSGPVADAVNVIDSVTCGTVPDFRLGRNVFGANEAGVFARGDFRNQLVRDILKGHVRVVV